MEQVGEQLLDLPRSLGSIADHIKKVLSRTAPRPQKKLQRRRLDHIEKRCNHYTLIVACMLSGASQDRPVIVGWSSAPRDQVIEKSLGQLPKPPECHYFCHY